MVLIFTQNFEVARNIAHLHNMADGAWKFVTKPSDLLGCDPDTVVHYYFYDAMTDAQLQMAEEVKRRFNNINYLSTKRA